MGGQFLNPLRLVREAGSLAAGLISWPLLPVSASNPGDQELQGTCAAWYCTSAVWTCILRFSPNNFISSYLRLYTGNLIKSQKYWCFLETAN